MGRVNKNIAYLRKQNRWTQGELAKKLNIPRSTLGGYEKGYAEPGLESILKFSKILKVSVDDLISRQLWEGERRVVKEEGMKVLAISVDSENKSNIELVEAKAEAGYMGSFDDPAYLKNLPKISMPILQEGTYRAFEIRGESMLPMSNSDIVICSYVEKIGDIKDGETYIIVHKSDGIAYKRIRKNEKENCLILISDNDLFSPYQMDYSSVSEVWKYEAHISFQEPAKSAKEWMDSRLESISKDLKEVKSKIGNWP